jgi:hypothetical protein
LAEVFGEAAHQYCLLLDGADGAPHRLLGLLRHLRQQAPHRVGVAGVAAEAVVAALLKLQQNPAGRMPGL